MYPRIILTVFVSALLTAGTASAAVLGDDDRRAAGAEEAQLLRALGLIFCFKEVDGVRRRSAGTATIVGNRNTILTAAHVFTDDAGPRGARVQFDAVNDCTFRQYDSDGRISSEVGFFRVEMGAFRLNPGAPNQDWAVLKTTQPLPASATALPFADEGSDIDALAGLPIMLLAYHADIRAARRTPLLSEGALLSVDYGGYPRLAHTADMGRMSSGAAIVHRGSDGRHVVVGVNRSAATTGEFNLAVSLSPELRRVLRSYAYGLVPIHRQRLAGLVHTDAWLSKQPGDSFVAALEHFRGPASIGAHQRVKISQLLHLLVTGHQNGDT